MKHRMSRSHAKRSKFQIDNILAAKIKNIDRIAGFPNDYMTLMFSGFFDHTLSEDVKNLVQVETILLKISHKKRKDNLSDMSHVVLGVMNIEINPTDNKIGFPTVNIPTESIKPTGHHNETFMLVFKIQTFPFNVHSGNVSEELTYKKFKANTKLYASELIIFDKNGRCVLTEGEYALCLDEIHNIRQPPSKVARWETLPDSAFDTNANAFESLEKCPSLKFRLIWYIYLLEHRIVVLRIKYIFIMN